MGSPFANPAHDTYGFLHRPERSVGVRFHEADWPVAAKGKLIEAHGLDCILSAAPIHSRLGAEHAPAVRGEPVGRRSVDDGAHRVAIDPVVFLVDHEVQVVEGQALSGVHHLVRRARRESGFALEAKHLDALGTGTLKRRRPAPPPRCRKCSRSCHSRARSSAFGAR
jgi:hypothetical protein